MDRVEVDWPWGERQRWEGLALNSYWRLSEGVAAAGQLPADK